jgi:mRNA-degrading endonuclease RelE of RelBE toxin-antitoxin system
MPYEIVVHELAVRELESLRAYEQRRLVDEIRSQLTHEPGVSNRRRKCLVDLRPSFEHEMPVWELRVGDLRVFYDLHEVEKRVHIRAVRRKRASQTTEDIT